MKISIITVCLNSDNTIQDTYESVLNQKYEDIEYIVVDGGSTDKTLEITEEYESNFSNSKKQFKWISEKDNGIYDAINKGIKLSTGDIIGILNSDDYYIDEMVLKDINDEFEKQECDCLYGNLKYINPITNKISRNWVSKPFKDGLFEKSWTPAHPTFFCKKTIYEKIGYYRTDFKIAADVELMYRFLQIYKIRNYYYNRYFVVMRKGGISNNGLQSTIIITREMQKAFVVNGNKLRLTKYLFYKGFKLKEFFVSKK